MKAAEIIERIEDVCPTSLACDWDNVGLLCGDRNAEVRTVFLALDATPDTVKEAIKEGADMMITHHPILFRPIRRLTPDDSIDAQLVSLLIEHHIPLYSAHTNFDAAEHGLNSYFASLFPLSDVEILEPYLHGGGIGRIGRLTDSSLLTLSSLCAYTKQVLGTNFVRVCGSLDQKVQKIALVNGSGEDYIDFAIGKGADVLITGDIKYHTALDAAARGLCIIDAGHYPTEIAVLDLFSSLLKDTGLVVKKSCQTDIFTLV